MTAYDVGANVGFYTLALSSLVGQTGHVYAFEPEPRNVAMLLRHLHINDVRNVTIIQAAVTERTGLISIGGSREMAKIVPTSELMVPCISLDDFVAAGNPRPDLVKVDNEGSEVATLLGARRLIAEDRAIWLVGDDSMRTCERIFRNCGSYRIATFEGVTPYENAEADFVAIPKS